MTDSCDYAKLSNTPCGKLLYARHTGRKNIKELHGDLKCIFLWRARLLEEKDNVFTICFHHEQFLGRYLRERQRQRQRQRQTERDWSCPVNTHGVAEHSRASNAKGKLKKVLNVYKDNISAAYYLSDI